MLLERVGLHHRVEEVVAARLRLLVAGRAFHVPEEVVAVAVVGRLRAQHLRHFSVGAEVKRLFRDLPVGV